MSDSKSASTDNALVYECSNKSLRNTTIASPDGRTSYIIETPLKWFGNTTSTISALDREKDGSTPRVIASIDWRYWSPDIVTFTGQSPRPAKEILPKKYYKIFWTGRWANDVGAGARWRGERCPELVSSDGKVLAAYKKKMFSHEAGTLTISPEAASKMNEVILGLLVVHRDAVRRRHARWAGSCC